MRITNKNAKNYVNSRLAFKGNHTFGMHHLGLYVVYSYGEYFPMYVYINAFEKWYGNSDNYSYTTSKHKSLLKPNKVEKYFTTEILQQIISNEEKQWWHNHE